MIAEEDVISKEESAERFRTLTYRWNPLQTFRSYGVKIRIHSYILTWCEPYH